jgi:hypothetical protein
MPVPSVITDLSATAASNSPAGGDAVFPDLDNYLRAHASLIRQGDTKASDIASASTTAIGGSAGRIVDVTGTTSITSFGTVAAGIWRLVRFTGALTLTHNATSLILPGGVNIVTGAGDTLLAVSLGSGNWVVTDYTRAVSPRFFAYMVPTTAYSGTAAAICSSASFASVTEVLDTSSSFNTSTGRFVSPVTGYYQFSASVTVGYQTGAYNAQISWNKNGTIVSVPLLGYGPAAASSEWQTITSTVILLVNAGEYVQCEVGCNNTTTINIYSGTITGHLLG